MLAALSQCRSLSLGGLNEAHLYAWSTPTRYKALDAMPMVNICHERGLGSSDRWDLGVYLSRSRYPCSLLPVLLLFLPQTSGDPKAPNPSPEPRTTQDGDLQSIAHHTPLITSLSRHAIGGSLARASPSFSPRHHVPVSALRLCLRTPRVPAAANLPL